MSPKSMRWRDRALRVAVTVSCASSLQFSGCLNNPTRSDLANEAGKAALIAEEDIAHQKMETAEAVASAEKGHAKEIALAGGEETAGIRDSQIVQTGGEKVAEEKPAKKSFWSFFSFKSKKPAVKDPFAEHPELKSAEKTSENQTVGKARLASSSVAVPDPKPAEKDAFSPDNWFEKELAGQPSPSWAAESKDDVLANRDRSASTTPANVPASAKTRPDSPAAAFPDDPVWIPKKDGTSQNTVARSTEEEGRAQPGQDLKAAQRPFPSTTSPTPAPKSADDSVAKRHQKLRVQALMSDAHTSALRGELHAAYRCALLAEKVAADSQLVFADGEETPQEFARVLAAKLWRTSNSSEETYAAAADVAPGASLAMEPGIGDKISPAEKETAPAASSRTPFSKGAFATWQPLPDQIDQRPVARTESAGQQNLQSATGNLVASRSSSPFDSHGPIRDVLPEIRPWPNERSVQGTEPPQKFALSSNPSNRALPQSMKEQSGAIPQRPTASPAPMNSGSDPGVQFAIAHQVAEDSAPELIDPFTAGTSSGRSERSQGQHMGSVAMDQQRPVLLAPPTPAENASLSTAEAPLTWEQLSRSHQAKAQNSAHAAAQRAWRMTWAILGLIGAGLSIAAGIWYTRRQNHDEDPSADQQPMAVSGPAPAAALEIVTDPASATDEVENQPLPFKRAA